MRLRAAGYAPSLPDEAACERFAGAMRQAVRTAALNELGFLNGVFSDTGEWFFSDRDPDGATRFNTPVNAFGVIAGIFEPQELPPLLARLTSIRRDYGYPLFTPALGVPPVTGLGRIGSGDLPPGLGENGSCYNHGCHGFLARALALLDQGDLFIDVMGFMFPYDQTRHPVTTTRSAPYAIVNVYKSAPGREGEGGDTFFSGTISVAVRNVYQGLLGAYADPTGIQFRPCLPTAWSAVSGRIQFAGQSLAVAVERVDGAYRVSVNGQPLAQGWFAA